MTAIASKRKLQGLAQRFQGLVPPRLVLARPEHVQSVAGEASAGLLRRQAAHRVRLQGGHNVTRAPGVPGRRSRSRLSLGGHLTSGRRDPP